MVGTTPAGGTPLVKLARRAALVALVAAGLAPAGFAQPATAEAASGGNRCAGGMIASA
jgi:hypothetical protein